MRITAGKTYRALIAYAAVCVSVWLVIFFTRRLDEELGESISPLFFAVVMLSAWFGGWGPGLFATVLAGWASAYYFPNNQPGSPVFGWDDAIRVAVFFMVAALISSLTALRKRAQDALQASHASLEQRVKDRTAELRESEERFRVLIEGVHDYAIVMLDPAGLVLSWNGGAGRIEGYGPEEVVGQHISRFFLPDEVARGQPQRHLEIAATAGRHEDEGLRVRKDGQRFMANVITTPLRDEAGRLRGFAQVTRDVTELRNLEQEVLQISESERRHIGHDLHDGLGQQLTGVALLTQNLAGTLADRSAAEAADAERIGRLVHHALEQIRALAHGLSPVEIGPDGLRAALHNLAAQMKAASRVAVEFRGGAHVRVDDAAALHLYRIAQEAVNNAVRHSRATRIELSLEARDGGAALIVRDNGVGFDPALQPGNGMGVRVMHYRARMMGAALQVESRERSGTVVSCIVAAGEPARMYERSTDVSIPGDTHAQEPRTGGSHNNVAHPAG